MGHSQIDDRSPGSESPKKLTVVLDTGTKTEIESGIEARPSASADGVPAEIKMQFDFLWNTHKYLNDAIRFADTKAGFTVALACTIVGALFAGKLHHLFLLIPPRQWTPISWLSAAAFLGLGASIASGVWTICPRLSNKQPKGFLYWGGVTEHGSPENFWAKMKDQSQEALVEHLAHHAFCLSEISRTKYFWVSLAMTFGALGGLLAALVLLFK